jgi:hypothetical protein
MHKLKNLRLTKDTKGQKDRNLLVKEYTESIGDLLAQLISENDSVEEEFQGAVVNKEHLAA